MATSATLCAWITCILSSTLVKSQSNFRLPTTVKPIHYDLTLHPNIANRNFLGEELIEIEIQPSYFDNDINGNFRVSFNYYPSNAMQITLASLIVNETVNATDNNQQYALFDLSLNATTQIATATFSVNNSEIERAYNNAANFTLSMSYSANLRGGDDLAGWYISSYDLNGTTLTNLVTQFQATDARSAFPCFDEPDFKATFEITLIAPVDAVTLSNMPIAESSSTAGSCPWTNANNETKDECQRVRFARTPRMSTYLVALIVGGYDVTNVEQSDGVEQRVFFPYTFDLERANTALVQSVQVLNWFGGEFGFDIPYTDSGISKLDSIGVSDFAAGAMENWGMVVYRTVRLLVSRNESSQAAKSRQILIIAHELAHQWFGNLVSPQWWDDLWLNEGFATYMAYYGSNLVQTGYEIYDLKYQALSDVMIDDASIYTQPVRVEIAGDPTQILSLFSSITYQKGMGVINSMANHMGESRFRSGITSYLRQYEFRTANSSQLGDVLAAADGGDGVKEVMDSFIYQAGFPLISVALSASETETALTFTQQRFVKLGAFFYDTPRPHDIPFVTDEMVEQFAAQTWTVPMKLAVVGDADDVQVVNFTLEQQSMQRSLSNAMQYFVVNPIDESDGGLYSFHRTFYDEASLQLILDNFGEIEAADQFEIISDRYALMIASYISPDSYLDFLRSAVDKMLAGKRKGPLPDGEEWYLPHYPTWNVIIQSLIAIDDILCELIFDGMGATPADDLSIRLYFRDLAQEILRKALYFLVVDMESPYCDGGCFVPQPPQTNDDGEDEEEEEGPCPEGAVCYILRGSLLQALVRLGDSEIIAEGYEIFYQCENQECYGKYGCTECIGPIVNDSRVAFVSDDVFQAMIAAVLSYDTSSNDEDWGHIRDLYARVNIEQQTYILNALGALYVDTSGALIEQALNWIDTSSLVRSNMKVNAFVAMKQCSARQTLWQWMIEADQEDGAQTRFDRYLNDGSGLFSQEPLTALPDSFASTSKYSEIEQFFNDSNSSRVNAGTQQTLQQSLENVYTRFLWKQANYDSLQLYLRTYVVQKYEENLDVWQIILITVACCAGLVVMVCAFWAGSKPSDSDRFEYYMSMKHNKRERRKSSQIGAAPHPLTSSLGHSLDRSLRANSQIKNNYDIDTPDDAVEQDEHTAQQGRTRGKSRRDVQEETAAVATETELQTAGDAGYGATEAFNYSSLKHDP